MGHIFISYSRRNTETVDGVVRVLCAAGLNIWIDREDIHAGNEWQVQIVEAIDTCDAFVLMLSPFSTASVNVRKEIDLAQGAGRAVFVISLEPTKIPDELRYQLAGLQILEVQTLGFEHAVSQLIHCLQEHIASLQPVQNPETCKAELVIKGIKLKDLSSDMRAKLLDFVAQLSNTSVSRLELAGVAVGSLHVFINMPAGSAHQIKTLALNRDRRFKEFKTLRIVSLRLAGDIKYVNIALGILTATATIGFLQTLWFATPPILAPTVGVEAGKVLTIFLGLSAAILLVVNWPPPAPPVPNPSEEGPTLTIPHPTTTTPVTLTTAAPSTPIPITTTLPAITTSAPITTIPPTTEAPKHTPTPYAVVVTAAYCYCGADNACTKVGWLYQNTQVILIGAKRGDWWFVQLPGTPPANCWILEKHLEIYNDTSLLKVSYPQPCMPTSTRRPRPAPTFTPTPIPIPT